MELYRLFDWLHQNVHHLAVNILFRFQIQSVQQNTNLERVILYANDEKLHEFLMSDFIFLRFLELLILIFFAVHLEHNVNVLSCDQEPFSIVLSNSLLNFIV
jgi:hypothetical protein